MSQVVRWRFADNFDELLEALQEGSFRSLNQAAFQIRDTVIQSIVRARGPSTPGSPPHTHRGTYLKRSILYDVDKQAMVALIGPRFSAVGDVGEIHEFGGHHRGQDYPERSFMGPALDRNAHRFAQSMRGTVRSY